jgi:hypothetical protein
MGRSHRASFFTRSRIAPRRLCGIQCAGHRDGAAVDDAGRDLAAGLQGWLCPWPRGGRCLLDGAVERDRSDGGAPGFYLEEDGKILVEVHQLVRDLAGSVIADDRVGHRFAIEHGLIRGMEVAAST